MANGKKVYDFSSVGEDFYEKIEYADSVLSPVPLNIATPIRFSNNNDGTFVMHKNYAKQIADNFKNMIATNHGERLILSDFGANLKNLTFELGNENADRQAIRQILATTKKYMPFIELNTFESTRIQNDNNSETLKIRIVYNVSRINLVNQAAEILFPVK